MIQRQSVLILFLVVSYSLVFLIQRASLVYNIFLLLVSCFLHLLIVLLFHPWNYFILLLFEQDHLSSLIFALAYISTLFSLIEIFLFINFCLTISIPYNLCFLGTSGGAILDLFFTYEVVHGIYCFCAFSSSNPTVGFKHNNITLFLSISSSSFSCVSNCYCLFIVVLFLIIT